MSLHYNIIKYQTNLFITKKDKQNISKKRFGKFKMFLKNGCDQNKGM